jgi:uncharacterized protein (TIRG00374 family)
MDVSAPGARGGRYKWTAVGILVSLLFLWLSTSRVPWGDLGAAMSRVHLWPWLPLAVAAYLLGHLVRGLRCRMIVAELAPISLLSATNVVVLGYGANNILPARLGELARAGMLAQRTGLSYVQCLTVTFLERILDAIVILVLFVIAASRRELPGWVRQVSDVAMVIVSMATLVVLAAVLLPSLLPRAATHLTARLHERLGGRLVSTAYDIVQALAPLRKPTRAAGVLALSLLVWTCEAGLFLAVLPAFDLLASPALAALAMSMTNLGILAPSSPGFVGPFHYFCAKAIETSGANPTVALSYAITVHAAFFVPVTTWAIGVIVSHGVQLSKTISLARSARVVTKLSDLAPEAGEVIAAYRVPQPAPRATRFLTAVIEPMLPWELVALPEADRAPLLGSVTEFVAGQVDALPKHLRWKARLGLFGFAVIFQLSTLGRLHRLPLERRRRLVEAWAFGRLSLPRQLFRLLRGTALLAFCDHPLVAAKLDQRAGVPQRLTVVKGPA